MRTTDEEFKAREQGLQLRQTDIPASEQAKVNRLAAMLGVSPARITLSTAKVASAAGRRLASAELLLDGETLGYAETLCDPREAVDAAISGAVRRVWELNRAVGRKAA